MDGAGGGIFPRHCDDLLALSDEQLNALEVFYGKRFYGDDVQTRRIIFARYIGAHSCMRSGP